MMFTEPTMDATRRMLLERNCDNNIDEGFSLEDIETLIKECTKCNMSSCSNSVAQRQESCASFAKIPSILRARKRRRAANSYLNSAHHPRLRLLALGKI